MKLLKKIASLAVATVIVVQGAGLGSLSVLADGDIKPVTTKADVTCSPSSLVMQVGETKTIDVSGQTVDIDALGDYSSVVDVTVNNNEDYDTYMNCYNTTNGAPYLYDEHKISECLVDIEELSSGQYVIKSVDTGLYLDIDTNASSYMFSGTEQPFTITHEDGSEFFNFTQVSNGETLFYSDRSFCDKSRTLHLEDMVLYKKVDGEIGSTELPGYEPVTSITSGEKYIIAAKTNIYDSAVQDIDSLYVVYPSQTTQRRVIVGDVSDKYITGSSVITVTAVAAGETTLTIGNAKVSVKVVDLGEPFTYDNTFLKYAFNSGNEKVTSIVFGNNPDNLKLLCDTSKIKEYFSTNENAIKVNLLTTGTSTGIRVYPQKTADVGTTEYICVKYEDDNGNIVTNSIPVYFSGVTGSKKIISNVKNIDNVTVYYNLANAVNNEGQYLSIAVPGSSIMALGPATFFIKPDEGFDYNPDIKGYNAPKYVSFDNIDYWSNIDANMVKEAKNLGCTGGFVVVDNIDNTNIVIGGEAVLLPTVTAEEWAILRGGDENDSVPYTSDEVIFAGDRLVWKITVDVPEDMTAVFGETKLSSTLAGSDMNGNGNSKEISKDLKVGEVVEYRLVFDVPEDMTSAEFEIAINGTYTLGTSDAKNYSVTKSFSFDVTKKPAPSNKVNIYTEDLTVSPETTIQTIDPLYPLSTSDKIYVSKIYYVVAGQEATLKDFADGNDLDCIFNIYKLDGTDVTSSFKVADDSTSMLFTATESGEQNYIITYSSGVYAVRIVVMKPVFFKGMVVEMGSALRMNYLVGYANETNARENASKKGYKYASEKAVDYSNLLDNVDINSYTVKMYKSGEDSKAINKGNSGDFSRFAYENILPYQIGDKIIGDVYDSNGNLIDTVSYSIKDYLDMAMTKNPGLYTSVLVYCAFAEKYAAESGWIDSVSSDLSSYTSSVPTATITSNTYSNIKTDNCEFNEAYLTLEEGMAVSITVEFKLGADVDLSSCNMIIYSDVNDGLHYMGSGASYDKNSITIPGTEFVSVAGKENTYKFTITGIPPVYWRNAYKMYLDIDGADKGLSFSVNDYLMKLEAKTEDGTTLDSLLKAMYSYGDEVYKKSLQK